MRHLFVEFGHDLRGVLASGGKTRVLPWRPASVAAVAGRCG